MKMIKRVGYIILVVLVVFASGCGRNFITTTDSDPMCEKVLKYLDNDDAEGLKSMFCEKTIAQTPDLEEQIQAAMDFYEGKTVSHGNILTSEGESVRDGVTTKLDMDPHITDIKTDAGGKYNIRIYSYLIFTEDPTMKGISQIDIYTEDDTVCTIGKLLD